MTNKTLEQLEITERACTGCGVIKDIEKFSNRHHQCKLCLNRKAVEKRHEKKLERIKKEKRIRKQVKNMSQFEYERGYKLTADVVGGGEGISIRLDSGQDDYAIILPPLIAKSFGEWLMYTVTN